MVAACERLGLDAATLLRSVGISRETLDDPDARLEAAKVSALWAKATAKLYLELPDVAVSEVAYLLGFADQSSFFRACRRWFDLSPGEYRSQLHKSRLNAGHS